jgi:predicted ArsR family transcriptional regulator
MSQDDARPSHRPEVLSILRDTRDALSISDIAARLGVHPNTVRFHLNALIAAGMVQRVAAPASRPGRPPLMFRPVRAMNTSGPSNYRLLADILLTDLAAATDAPARAVELGRRWALREVTAIPGPATASTTTATLTELLDRLGFAPQTPTANRIDLRNCPFLDAVQQSGRLVCALHLGMLQGAAERLKGPTSAVKLTPFAEPDMCRVTVAHSATPEIA